jgi:hypothetical protein
MVGGIMANNPFITQADPMMSQTLIDPESQALQRQKQYAAALMQQNQQPQGQMIGGRFVAPSFTQQLSSAINPLLGAYMLNQADTKQSQLTLENQALAQKNIADALRLSKGGEETVYGAGMEGPTKEVTQIAPDSNAAIAKLLRPNATAMETGLGTKLLERQFREPKYQEVNIVNDKTGNTETYRYDINAPDPKSTMQLLGVNKPALSPSDLINFQDKNIAVPSNFGGGGMPVGGGNMPVANNNVGGVQTNPSLPTVKPVSATNVKQNDLVQSLGYDPFKPPPPPAGLPSSEAVREYKKDQFKPLDGESRKAVVGAASYQDALDKYLEILNTVNVKDLSNPQVRSKIDSAYNTAMLTGKEAFKLGVLNGGDERILKSLFPNYSDMSSFLVTKDTIKNLAQTQKEFGTGIILKEYSSANKPVPEMYRKHIVIPKEVEAGKNDSKSSKNKTVVRTGVVKDGPNRGKTITQYSDGTTEYR